MTETEARTIAKDTHLFGYEPEVIKVNDNWHLMVQGGGQDDEVVSGRLFQLRKPSWGNQ